MGDNNGGLVFVPVFVSHSFEDKSDFENITDALAQADVPYWNPAEVQPGSSLRDQIRRAVKDCELCILVATRHSLSSSWCGAELGAFWGAGKPIIVYVVDSSLTDNDLPPIVQGDVWERRISRIASRAKELLNRTATAISNEHRPPEDNVGNMTAAELERVIIGALSLAAATAKHSDTEARTDLAETAKAVAATVTSGLRDAKQLVDTSANWRKQVLWVDDRPDNNVYERRALEALGISFTLALSTNEALNILGGHRFGAIISDMGRQERPREGYVLLDALRARGDKTPFIIYAGSNSPMHKRQTLEHGGQGCTNNPQELLQIVTEALR